MLIGTGYQPWRDGKTEFQPDEQPTSSDQRAKGPQKEGSPYTARTLENFCRSDKYSRADGPIKSQTDDSEASQALRSGGSNVDTLMIDIEVIDGTVIISLIERSHCLIFLKQARIVRLMVGCDRAFVYYSRRIRKARACPQPFVRHPHFTSIAWSRLWRG